MIVKGIDLANDIYLLARVNILKKELTILEEAKDINKYIYGLPSTKLIFRTYKFPFKNPNKIKKALEGNLRLDLPINLEDVVYRYIYKERDKEVEIFCFIARKEDIEELQSPNSIIDTEILALLRVAKQLGIYNGEIIHFNKEYTLKLSFEDLFPREVRILPSDTKLEISENTYLSGFIPEGLEGKILKNRLEKPEYNVACGLLLNPIDNLSVDFSFSKTSEGVKRLLKGSLFLALAIAVLNLALFSWIYVKNKEIKKIKSAEKEIFIKYFSQSGEVYDPLMQAKGLLKTVKSGKETVKHSPLNILSKIGIAKKSANILDIEKIDIFENSFVIQGVANSFSDVGRFKDILSRDFKVSIEETSKLEDGKSKFTIRGTL